MIRKSTILLAAAAISASAGSAAAQSSFTVRGVVYDFLYSHPDFGINSGDVVAHTSGLVDLEMASTGVPTLSGAGASVATPAYDKDGNPIALHMATTIDDLLDYAMTLENSPFYRNNPTVDGYDPDLGPYGGGNVHPAPDPTFAPELPQITFPATGPIEPDVLVERVNNYYMTDDIYTNNLTIQRDSTVVIDGNLTWVVDGTLLIYNNSSIELTDGSTLKIYVRGTVDINNTVDINTIGQDHKDVTIYYSGTNVIDIGNAITYYGSIYAPNAELFLNNGVEYYGTMAVDQFRNRNDMGLHLAGPSHPSNPLCYWPTDLTGATASSTTGGITSDSTFATWFQDTPGQNAGMFYRYAFVQQPDGSYLMEKNGFDPIGGELYGNEGASNNGNFTSVIDAQFVYDKCAGHYIEVATDGEMWVYINGDLVIDMSGNVSGAVQRVDFDRLVMDDGGMYDMTFFFASRTGKAPNLSVRTNAVMFSTFDVAMPGIYLGD